MQFVVITNLLIFTVNCSGNSFFLQNTIVVDDSALEFPADVDSILGANFLVSNRLDNSTSRWSLLQSGSDLLNDPQPEVEYDTPMYNEILHSSLDEESSNIKQSTIKNKKSKLILSK